MRLILYVSDLDGTLAGPDERLSRETVEIINTLIDNGLAFTIATARSLTSAAEMIAPLHLQLPVILNNGAFIYHPLKKRYIAANFLFPAIVERLVAECRRHGVSPTLHLLTGEGKMRVYYREAIHPGEKHYICGRQASGDPRFLRVNDLRPAPDDRVYALLVIGDQPELAALAEKWSADPEIAVHYAQDIYSGAYWLEATDRRATKKWAVQFLRDLLSVEKVVCFGDHLNDLSMFEEADEAYAVANAHELLKSKASGVIEANDRDGVARFLLQRAAGGRANTRPAASS
ncbi:MAG: HAD family hydrolase [Firmicutes bacterium]|nr:HAD family hydrolase [Bacillota bacterium]